MDGAATKFGFTLHDRVTMPWYAKDADGYLHGLVIGFSRLSVCVQWDDGQNEFVSPSWIAKEEAKKEAA